MKEKKNTCNLGNILQTPDKCVIYFFFISHSKHMLRVLKKLSKRDPKDMLKLIDKKIFAILLSTFFLSKRMCSLKVSEY